MSRTAPSLLSLVLIATLAGGSRLCGEVPQERIVQRPAPNAQRPLTPPPTATQTRESLGTAPDPGPRPLRGQNDRGVSSPRRIGNNGSAAVIRPRFYPGSRTVIPRQLDRAVFFPTPAFWHGRDLTAEIKWMARSGFIPVSPIGDSVDMLTDYSQQPAGWRAYGVSVPAGGTVVLEVQHPKSAWFRLMLMDKWGQPGPGMLESAIAYRPIQVFYKNPDKEARAVYVIVDDPGWWSDAKDPYTLLIRRDWDPAKTDLSQVKMVAGLWGAMPSVSAEFRGPSLSGPAVYPR
ncbi:hypothetical protein [Geothrix sp. PMB-07]|uniref:hypothetical protein n=1 Tax=Geothrix sp. PMB-07 TaxID=3068640 RepID=UPI0027404051|nr:hypothetical protein [Geothrix sp. PMB-07]WLT30344.1 hypothetical protein Q9293_11500 [Geothrix sp. PMB-07]